MHFRQAILKIDGKEYLLHSNRANSFETFYADFQQTEEAGGIRYSVFIHPKHDITVERLELQFDRPAGPKTRFFANGYQSQSESRLLPADDALPRLRNIAVPYLGFSGDEHINTFSRGRGALHSWSYTYLKDSDTGSCVFAGSLNEKTGFTLFQYDRPNGLLRVQKDLDRLPLSHSFPILDIWVGAGAEKEVFERYTRAAAWPKPEALPALAWTSGRRNARRLSAALLGKNLRDVAESGLPFEYFCLDDGWETETGDWMQVKPAFPQGLAPIAAQIRTAGLKPGLCLSPFVVARHAGLAKHNPGWLLKGKKGNPLRAGWNPDWGGWYCALDFYNPQVRDYLSGVFHRVVEQWGFEMLKLDHLFAACLAPPAGKTRGQVMYEAMEFLRRLSGGAKIIGCGVPLGACFGQIDYLGAGNDGHVGWERRIPVFLHHRERASALAALRSNLGRWQQNGLFWGNAPGAFTLHRNRQKMTPVQQQTLLTINVLLGALLVTSDNPGEWSEDQRSDLEDALFWRGSRIETVEEIQKDVYRIDFEIKQIRYAAWANLTGKLKQPLFDSTTIDLQPYETMVLKGRPM